MVAQIAQARQVRVRADVRGLRCPKPCTGRTFCTGEPVLGLIRKGGCLGSAAVHSVFAVQMTPNGADERRRGWVWMPLHRSAPARRLRRHTATPLLTVLGVLAVLVAGCTAKPDLASKRVETPARASSVNATVGHVRLLAVRVEAPEDDVHVAGDNVGLFMTMANDGGV